MKYIITENRLNNLVVKYLEHMFKDKIYNESGFNYDIDDDDENLIMFYDNDYKNNIEHEPLFEYIFKEYYDNLDPDSSWVIINKWADKAPLIEIIRNEFVETLNSTFGRGEWKPGFKIWFEKTFELPVKTIAG
jgi:hypothetical protein